MLFNVRSIGSVGLLVSLAALSSASGLAQGGADNNTFLTSVGPDITLSNYVLVETDTPYDQTGTGVGTATNTSNTPALNETYYNTNGEAFVPMGGSAADLSFTGAQYFFTNSGTTTEYVTMTWQGFATASTVASGPGATATDIASSYLVDVNLNVLEYQATVTASTTGNPSPASVSNNGVYTFGIGAGVSNYEVDSFTSNFAQVTPEPAPFAVLGLGAIGLFLRRRRR